MQMIYLQMLINYKEKEENTRNQGHAELQSPDKLAAVSRIKFNPKRRQEEEDLSNLLLPTHL